MPGVLEQRLKACGLGEHAGRKIGPETITYGHQIEHFGEFEGKVIYEPPTGERLEDGWTVIV